MELTSTSTLEFAKLFARATRDVIQSTTGQKIEVSKTAMGISGIQIMGEIGTFVAFKGDYSGIMVLNFEGGAALEIVVSSLIKMGLPEEDTPKHHSSDDVIGSMGELANQVVGRCRSLVEEKFDLSASAHIPSVVPIGVPIALTMITKNPSQMECIRVSFTTEKRNKFYMEIALEPMLLAPLNI